MIILAPKPKEFTDDFWKVKNFKLSIGEIVEKGWILQHMYPGSNSQTNMRTVIGKKPETLGDLRETMDYVEKQSLHLLSAAHRTGRELQRFQVKGASRRFDGSRYNGGWGYSPYSGHGHAQGIRGCTPLWNWDSEP